MSEQGVELLTQWEGSRTDVYEDSGGKATIGVGHLLTPAELSSGTIMIDESAVDWRSGISEENVLGLLRQDLAVYERAVTADVSVMLTQNEFDALVSFAFNEGTSSLATSTLLKDVNNKDFSDVPAQFMRWTKVGNTVVQGLVNRRENEVKLWLGEFGTDTSSVDSGATSTSALASSSESKSYTVQAGDTLASVAAQFEITVADLADGNDLVNPADFKPGLVVSIR